MLNAVRFHIIEIICIILYIKRLIRANNPLFKRIPLILFKVYGEVVAHLYSVIFKALCLYGFSAKRESLCTAAKPVDYAKARRMLGVWIEM